MPLFYLNLNECGSLTVDDEGYELANLDAARGAGVAAARDIMAEEIKSGTLCLSCRIEVTDANGVVLMVVPFKDGVGVTGFE